MANKTVITCYKQCDECGVQFPHILLKSTHKSYLQCLCHKCENLSWLCEKCGIFLTRIKNHSCHGCHEASLLSHLSKTKTGNITPFAYVHCDKTIKKEVKEENVQIDDPLRLSYPVQSLCEPVTYEHFFMCTKTFKSGKFWMHSKKIQEEITIFFSMNQLLTNLNLGLCRTKFVGLYTNLGIFLLQ